MISGLLLIGAGLFLIMLLEKLYPDRKLENVNGWWIRVLLINVLQLIIVVIGMYTWEPAFRGNSVFELGKILNNYLGEKSDCVGGIIAYIINTWIFYWWHLLRHEVYILWILFHQMHHSPKRIEVITSFYKHPFEILIDSIIITILIYPILGLNAGSSIWVSGLSAFGEFFYHMNIKTPKWIGFIFQRPESHRIHHLQNKRQSCHNYSDFPIWDMLNGTFQNEKIMKKPTGFSNDKEQDFYSMLIFKDVLSSRKHYSFKKIVYNLMLIILIILGLLQPIGYIFNFPSIRGLGLVSCSSPLPLVFSAYNGVETFSTNYNFEVTFTNDTILHIDSPNILYKNIDGPYNRKNVYGVLFSHGPFFTTNELLLLRDRILHYGICDKNLLTADVKNLNITVKSNDNQQWNLFVDCS